MHIPSRQTIQAWSRRAAVSVIVLIGGALVSEFFVALVRERGYYDHPSRTLSAVFDFLLRNPFVHLIAGAILGFAVGVWVESLVRRKELTTVAPQPPPRVATKPTSTMVAKVKAREIAAAIRHALKNRDTDDAAAFYQQFENEAAAAMDTLMSALGGIPPVTSQL